jgi:hypothetical protein
VHSVRRPEARSARTGISSEGAGAGIRPGGWLEALRSVAERDPLPWSAVRIAPLSTRFSGGSGRIGQTRLDGSPLRCRRRGRCGFGRSTLIAGGVGAIAIGCPSHAQWGQAHPQDGEKEADCPGLLWHRRSSLGTSRHLQIIGDLGKFEAPFRERKSPHRRGLFRRGGRISRARPPRPAASGQSS